MRSMRGHRIRPGAAELARRGEAHDAPGALDHGAHDERLLAVAQRHAGAGVQRAGGEHAHVGAHAAQRVDRLGAGDRARRRVQPAADDVDGQARMVGQRDGDVRVGGDDRRLEVVGQAARELERRRPAAERDDLAGADQARPPPGRRRAFAATSSGRRSTKESGPGELGGSAPPWTRRSSPASDELLQVAADGVERHAQPQREIRGADLALGAQPAQDELTALFAEQLPRGVDGGHALQNSAKSRKKPHEARCIRARSRPHGDPDHPARDHDALRPVAHRDRRGHALRAWVDPRHRPRVGQRDPHRAGARSRSRPGSDRHR